MTEAIGGETPQLSFPVLSPLAVHIFYIIVIGALLKYFYIKKKIHIYDFTFSHI